MFLSKIGVQERSGSEKERQRVPKGRQNEVKNETEMTSKFRSFFGLILEVQGDRAQETGGLRGAWLDSFESKEFEEFSSREHL